MFAFQKQDHLLDHRIVFLSGRVRNTGSVTAVNVVLRTRAGQQLLLPPERWFAVTWWRPGTGIISAGAKCEKLIEQVQGRIDSARVGVWSEVAIAIALKTAHAVDTWKVLCQ